MVDISSNSKISPDEFESNKNCSRWGTIKIEIIQKKKEIMKIWEFLDQSISMNSQYIRSEITKSALHKS